MMSSTHVYCWCVSSMYMFLMNDLCGLVSWPVLHVHHMGQTIVYTSQSYIPLTHNI